jgi:fructose-1,6-bisphosphatase II
MSVLVVAAPEHVMSLPDMYMQKLVVGPRAAGRVDIEAPVAYNLHAVADAYDRAPADLTVIMLDRPRHESLVAEVRRVGARIKLIADGDITASIAAAVEGTGDQVYIGIGGAAEGVITAAAMKCLGGEIQAKLWPLSRKEVEQARAHGIDDIETVLRTDDMVKGDVIFSATGVTSGDFLRGIDYFRDGARSHTLVMCTRCRIVRFVDTIHLFSDERREIRL